MADLFVSYARADRARVAPLVAALEGQGWSVWWDPEITPGQEFDRLIGEELGKARAAVVVWTPHSVASRWVRGEAREAADRGILAPVRFEGCELPIDLRAIHATDLDNWAEDADSAAFKSLTRSLRGLLGEGGTTADPAATKAETAALSVCVLPFANISNDPEQEYFSDGISEDIITDLSKVSALFVVARNTAFTFKGKAIDVPQLARQLSVSHVLEGSVRKAGNRVRITAQLIDGKTGGHVWAERWDRDLTDIFALQDEISQAVVAALKLKLLPEEKKAIAKRGTASVEAYNLYLMARRFRMGASQRRRELVIRLCRRALAIDPDYAAAWAQIAASQAAMAVDAADAAESGWEAAEKALALDPDLAEAHAVKARLLTFESRFEEAAEEAQTAVRLDPESRDANAAAGNWAFATRRYAEAAQWFERAGEIDKSDVGCLMMARQCRQALGEQQAAKELARIVVARVEKAIAAEPDDASPFGFGVTALAALGEVERAKEWTEHALLLEPDNLFARYNLACAMIQGGDHAFGLDLLEETIVKGGRGNWEWAKIDTDLDPVRADPRFVAMMERAEKRFSAA
ncbi:MAG TPA: TIR domain-containing protein [Caulobacteraceae bacterium]|nr:TIR domain-containing protein [Caulobacteraceae bacterium]